MSKKGEVSPFTLIEPDPEKRIYRRLRTKDAM